MFLRNHINFYEPKHDAITTCNRAKCEGCLADNIYIFFRVNSYTFITRDPTQIFRHARQCLSFLPSDLMATLLLHTQDNVFIFSPF
jgi:hypothetical protein